VPPISEAEMKSEQAPWHLDDYKIIFFYNVNLGIWFDEPSRLAWHELLSQDQPLMNFFLRIFREGSGLRFGTFYNCRLETDAAKAADEKAQSQSGGKGILTYTFYSKHTPVVFDETPGAPLASESYPHRLGDSFQLESIELHYDECQLRLTREGTLTMRFKFSTANLANARVDTMHFIKQVKYLRVATQFAFEEKAMVFVEECRKAKQREWQHQGITIKASDHEVRDILRTSFNLHKVFVFKGLLKPDSGNHMDSEEAVSVLGNSLDFMGILNQADWYGQYRSEHLENVLKKDIGYRRDEIYVTDSTSSLIVNHSYWEQDSALPYYISNVLLLMELIVSKLSFLDYLIGAASLSPSHAIRSDKDEADQIANLKELEARTREGLDLNQLVQHGFTKKFLSQLCRERDLHNLFSNLSDKIRAVYDAALLRWQAGTASREHNLSKQMVKYARLQVGWVIGSVSVAVITIIAAIVIAVFKK